jgi:hypothetical protein
MRAREEPMYTYRISLTVSVASLFPAAPVACVNEEARARQGRARGAVFVPIIARAARGGQGHTAFPSASPLPAPCGAMPRVAKFELRVLVGGVAVEEYTTAAGETYVETVRQRGRWPRVCHVASCERKRRAQQPVMACRAASSCARGGERRAVCASFRVDEPALAAAPLAAPLSDNTASARALALASASTRPGRTSRRSRSRTRTARCSRRRAEIPAHAAAAAGVPSASVLAAPSHGGGGGAARR